MAPTAATALERFPDITYAYGPRPDVPSPPLALLMGQYVASLAGLSPRTVETYRTGLQRFAEFLEATGHDPTVTPVSALWPQVVEDFAIELLRAPSRPTHATIETYCAGVKSFARYLIRRGYAPRLNYEQIRGGLVDLLGKRVYTPQRIDKRLVTLVVHVQNLPLPDPAERRGIARLEVLRDKALIAVLFGTALRRAEVAGLGRADVDDGYADEALIVGKGRKERVVFFDAETLAAIRAYLEARRDRHAPLFLRHDNRRGAPGQDGEYWRLSAQSVWYLVKQYALAVNVATTTHHFRHARATLLLNRGASLSQVQDILGHADPGTTKRVYAHHDRANLRAAFRQHTATAAELAEELERRRGV